MTNRLLPLAALLLLASCADASLVGAEYDDQFVEDIASGQTLVFVGTDPITLASDIYLVRALGGDLGAGEPNLRGAEAFGVEPLFATTESLANGSVVQGDADQLFPSEAPFVVPDEQGLRVLATSLTRSDDGTVVGGRLALVDIVPRRHRVSPFIEGLVSARFTWSGDWLVVRLQDPETGRQSLQVMEVDDIELEGALRDIGPTEPEVSVEFAETLRGTNAFLARVIDLTTGATDVARLDPDTGESRVLTSGTDGIPEGPRVSADGRLLSVTLRTESEEGGLRRAVAVFDLEADGPPIFTAGDADADCERGAWSPPSTVSERPILAYACRRLSNGRPDLLLWEAHPGEMESAPPPATLTASTQTAVPGGTIDGLVLRAGPLWDPSGRRIVFGASTEEQALDGEGMTILTFPLEDGLALDRQEPLAYSVYPSDLGTADWLHFSAGSTEPILMLWDRGETGLEGSDGGHPIEVVSVAEGAGLPRPVDIGLDVRVSFPMFLGSNTLFYR